MAAATKMLFVFVRFFYICTELLSLKQSTVSMLTALTTEERTVSMSSLQHL